MRIVCVKIGHEYMDIGIKQRDARDEYRYKLYLCKRCGDEHKVYLRS